MADAKITPCQDADNNPDDWFISKDGRQYSDDPFLTEQEIRDIANGVEADEGESDRSLHKRRVAAVAAETRSRKRHALTRRRHARERCIEACSVRLRCLEVALNPEASHTAHGTWGGHYEEDLRELRRGIANRRNHRKE